MFVSKNKRHFTGAKNTANSAYSSRFFVLRFSGFFFLTLLIHPIPTDTSRLALDLRTYARTNGRSDYNRGFTFHEKSSENRLSYFVCPTLHTFQLLLKITSFCSLFFEQRKIKSGCSGHELNSLSNQFAKCFTNLQSIFSRERRCI